MDDAGKMVMTVEELAKKLSISRGLAYSAIRTGEIFSVRVGQRRILVPLAALERFLEGTQPRQTCKK